MGGWIFSLASKNSFSSSSPGRGNSRFASSGVSKCGWAIVPNEWSDGEPD